MWTSFENGGTLGQRGSEEGKTIRDDEHSLGARLTLERDTQIAPFAITCGIYGWVVHTRFFSTEAEANSEFDKMRASLDKILSSLSDPNYSEQNATISAIEKFVAEYP